jgi:hypothetical protein
MSDGSIIGPIIFIIVCIVTVVGVAYFLATQERYAQIKTAESASLQKLADQSQIIIKSYEGVSRAEIMSRYQADSIEMAVKRYFPTSQTWTPGQWSPGAFIVAVLLCFFSLALSHLFTCSSSSHPVL